MPRLWKAAGVRVFRNVRYQVFVCCSIWKLLLLTYVLSIHPGIAFFSGSGMAGQRLPDPLALALASEICLGILDVALGRVRWVVHRARQERDRWRAIVRTLKGERDTPGLSVWARGFIEGEVTRARVSRCTAERAYYTLKYYWDLDRAYHNMRHGLGPSERWRALPPAARRGWEPGPP